MTNFEELLSLASLAGFRSTVIRPSSNAAAAAVARESKGDSLFSVCVAAPAFDWRARHLAFNARSDNTQDIAERNILLLREAARALAPDGVMFVYGLPGHLTRYATVLSDDLMFRYWIAIRTVTAPKAAGLRPEHTGLLLLSKPGAIINRIRIPHAQCRHCGEPLKDWGGKSHLKHPEGVALSDVWMDLVVNSDDRLPSEVFERILRLTSSRDRARLLLLVTDEARSPLFKHQGGHRVSAFDPLKWRAQQEAPVTGRALPRALVDTLHKAPCLDVLKTIPSETVDLAFADPPFNLTKKYNGYADDRNQRDYLGWCKRWLLEYERVLKPGGAIFMLNLPKWSAPLADFLTRRERLYLQNWIVWNSLPEPKGVLMPAHYALLYFTKGKEGSRFNYCSMENGWEPFDEAVFPPDRADVCQRRACTRKRRASASTWRGELTDIWHDIYRVRRAGKSIGPSKTHPCETPERLIDRIIRLTTNPGDIVLDAFAGTGTTALVARRLGRRFIAIEQDDHYLNAAARRVGGFSTRERTTEPSMRRKAISKRALQIELQRIARRLGRLPTKEDVEALSQYGLDAFEGAFSSWGQALKGAKAIASVIARQDLGGPPEGQMELFEPAADHSAKRSGTSNNCAS